jgi:hypothetical protein
VMAMEECGPGIICYKVHLDPLIRVDVDHDLHDARCTPAAYLHYFETVAVKMHRMRFIALVQEGQTVALAFSTCSGEISGYDLPLIVHRSRTPPVPATFSNTMGKV